MSRRWRLGLLAAAACAALALALAAGLWWGRSHQPAELPAGQLMAASVTAEWSAPLDALVVVARPARWADRIGRDPRRRPLVDPVWWGSVDDESLGPLPVAPSTVATAVLEAFPSTLAVGWWQGGWQIRGPMRAQAPLAAALAASGDSQVTFATVDGVARIMPEDATPGVSWQPTTPAVAPSTELACWVWSGQRHWLGRWRGSTLEVTEPGVTAIPPEPSRAALVLHADDLHAALAAAGIQPPRDPWLSVVTSEMEALLARPATLVLDELEPNDPLPRPRIALVLPWWDARRIVVARTRSALCPVGARVEAVQLDTGRRAERWRSSLLSWWAVEHDEGLIVASGERALVTGIEVAELEARPPGPWWSVNGPRLATSLQAAGHAHLLADLGVLPRSRLEELRRLAGPLAGFGQISWQRTAAGEAVHVQLD
jgi:hypothetical protein